MTGLNVDWALNVLDQFILSTEPAAGGFGMRGSDDEVAAEAQVVERILGRVLPAWRTTVPSDRYVTWAQHREAAIRARTELRRGEELRANLGEDAPDLSAAELHPWVWSGARSLWQSGHFREAVAGAITKLNAETQNKVGRRDVGETNLFEQAFSPAAPKPGQMRLRRMEDDGSNTYKSVQRGAMAFAEGIFAGIRNPLAHEAGDELTEQEALEYLAALSVLARWVDSASVVVPV